MERFTDAVARQRLSCILSESGLNQREFARRCGISSAVLSEALAGHHLLSIPNAQKVADYCQVSADWIQGGMCNRKGVFFEDAGTIANLFCEADPTIQADIMILLDTSLDSEHQANRLSTIKETLTTDSKKRLPGEFSEGALKEQLDNIQKQLDDIKNRIIV